MNDVHPDLLAAISHAKDLIEELGTDHPRTMKAIIHGVHLYDPGFGERTMAEVGNAWPRATHWTPDGQALYAVDQIASALGTSVQDVEDGLDGMDTGDDFCPYNGPVVKRQLMVMVTMTQEI